MRVLMLSILFLLSFSSSYSQSEENIKETARKFWEAVKVWNDEEIIYRGNILLAFVEENNFDIDSTIIEIMLYTSDSYIHLNEFENALSINLRSLELVYKKWGKENQFYTTLLNNIAMDYSYLGNDSLALKYNFEALLLKEKVFGKKNQSYARSLLNIADILAKNGDLQKAIEYNLEAIDILYASINGTGSPQDKERQRILFLHQTISKLYFSAGDFQKSIEHLIVITDYLENEHFTEVAIYSTCLIDLIDCYTVLLEKEKLLDTLAKFEKTLNYKNGKSDSNLLSKLDFLADSYTESDSTDRAIHYSLKIIENVELNDTVKLDFIIHNYNRLAFCYELKGDYNEALKYVNLNEKFIELAYQRSDDFDRYLTELINIAQYKGKNGLWEEARRTLLKSENNIINDNNLKAYYLSELAICEEELGNYNLSIKLSMEALELYESLFGIKSTKYLKCFSNLGNTYLQMELFDKALSIFLQVLQEKLQILPEHDLSIGIAYNQLAVLYTHIGDLEKAIDHMFKVIEIDALNYDENHPVLAHDYLTIAGILKKANLPARALNFEFEALKILENSLGINNLEYARGLVNVASTASILGYIEKSLEFDLKALKVYESLKVDSTKEYAYCLNALGSDYSSLNKYSQSIKYYLMAAELIKGLLGENNSSYSICMENIAIAYYFMQDLELFQKYIDLAFQYRYSEFENNKLGFSNSEQELFKRQTLRSLELLANSKILTNNKLDVIVVHWIKLNSLLSSSNKILSDKILSSDNEELRESLQKLIEMRKQYNYFSEAENNPQKTKLLLEECEKIERVLWQTFPEFKKANREIKSGDIVGSLKNDEVFIDIARFHKINLEFQWTDSSYYCFFIHDRSDSQVEIILIDQGKELENELISDYNFESSQKNSATDFKNEIFYNSFWKPIADKIGDAKTVYISLSGLYNNINLNTLYNPETGKYLIEEKDIRIVKSARDFVLSKEREKKIVTSTTASLYGFPDFNGNTTISVDTLDYLTSTRDLSQNRIDSLTRGNMKASPLPATKIEIENISSTFNKNGWNVLSYSQSEATESNIKKEKSPRVLHIATHAYFFEDIPFDTNTNRFFGMDRNQMVQDPMLRSGLLFTGANRTLKGETSFGENGLLSAAEASLLDLRETELVVLSACETGKGEVKNSEGVYGLRKAFSDAGAQNIIMSLWKVDDEVTQEFMTRFYEIWLDENKSIREAFNKTQLEIKAKYPQPYYWGAFILMGE